MFDYQYFKFVHAVNPRFKGWVNDTAVFNPADYQRIRNWCVFNLFDIAGTACGGYGGRMLRLAGPGGSA